MTAEINLQQQLNADGSLNYIQYKYKGSTVKIGFGYDTNGKMNKILIPPFLNLKHKEIFDIVNRFYIERINVIQLIQLINRIALIDAISSVTIANIKTTGTDIVNTAIKLLTPPVRITNGGFEDNFDGWTTTGAPGTPLISSTIYHSGSKSCLMEYSESIHQHLSIAITDIISFKVWVKKAAGGGNTYFTFTSTAGSMNYLLPGGAGAYDWLEVDLLAAMIAAGASGTLTTLGFLRMDDFHVEYWLDDVVLLDNAIDFATQTTLAALNAKDFATQA